MQKIIAQIAEELKTQTECISKVIIDEKNHYVDFYHVGTSLYAKLTKNNKAIRKNTIRRNTY